MDYDQNFFIESLLKNKPFLKEFLKQYLNCLNFEGEFQEFYRQYSNSMDGSLDKNKKFYGYKPLIQKINNKLIPTAQEVHEQK